MRGGGGEDGTGVRSGCCEDCHHIVHLLKGTSPGTRANLRAGEERTRL